MYVHYDLLGMDSLPFLNALYDGDFMPVLHPLSKLLHYLPRAFSSIFPVSMAHAVRFELAAIGGVNVVLAFLVLRVLMRNTQIAALFAVAFGFFFSNLVFFSVPETYLLSDSIVLVYALFLARFGKNMTLRRYLILSALAGAGASNNLPLAMLMLPHNYLLWKERKSIRDIVMPGFAGVAVMLLVFLGINGMFHNRDYFAELLKYGREYGAVSHFLRFDYLLQVAGSFFLYSVIAPLKDLSSCTFSIAAYFDTPGKLVLLAFYAFCLYGTLRYLAKNRDKVIDGLLLWSASMTLAYVFFSPWESFLYSSQLTLPVCLALAKTFDASRLRFKYSFAVVLVVLVGCNNLFSLYHPCEVNELIPRQPVMGKAFVGGRVKVLRERAGFTIQQLADKAGIAAEDLASGERGEKDMQVHDLDRISRTLGKPLMSLCWEVHESKPATR